MSEWIPEEEWTTIVRNVPIVSVDLLVRTDGGIVLGKRTNEPAKGEWFIPGGRVYKGETRTEAVHRIATEEMGVKVEILESLGAFEHIYDTAETDGVDSKHYLANGYVVEPKSTDVRPNEQHADFQILQPESIDLHPNIAAYLKKAETIE
ncbi:GDP-mannose mannosyl hydrolase [Halovenus halobia]|uniref:GDP-mannose mannosyl hydrolase n=1 Tax=Halovenus halobia TaxID=3396622 RepID=UPI003F544F66